jgi:hypothetical protein
MAMPHPLPLMIGGGPQPPSFVQGAAGNGIATLSFSKPVNAGDLLLAPLSLYTGGGESITGVSDNLNGPWSSAASLTNSVVAVKTWLFYMPNTKAGSVTVTASYSGSPSGDFLIAEYSNIATTNPLDQIATNSGDSASGTVGPTGNLAQQNELLYLVAWTNQPAEPTWSTPYTDPDPNSTGTHNAFAIATTTAAQSTSISLSSNYWNLILATFLPL